MNNQSEDCDSEVVVEETFIDCGVKDISNLHLKSNITTLNLHFNCLTTIRGLQHLKELKHLDLSSNLLTKITGLESLQSLRTLNLSSNRIKKVEGLFDLRQLVKINLSFNDISDLSGFSELSACDTNHPLTVIELQGNQIRLITHAIKHLQSLHNLRQLTLLEYKISNPVCSTPDYRNKLLRGLPQLKVLDGKDRSGNSLEIAILSDIPSLENFIDYLSSSTDVCPSDVAESRKIVQKLTKTAENLPVKPDPHSFERTESESTKDELTDGKELKTRLKDLEEKLNNLLLEKKNSPNEELKSENKEKSPQIFSSKENSNTNSKHDVKIAQLLKEIDREKRLRLENENKLQILINRLKELQLAVLNDRKQKEDALQATEKLSIAFSKEKSLRLESDEKLIMIKTCLQDRERELMELRQRLDGNEFDQNLKLDSKNRELLNKNEELIQVKKLLDESLIKQQLAESNFVSVKKHSANLEEQINDLQLTLSRREKEYQMNVANRFALDSKELKEYIENQVNIARNSSQQEITIFKERLNESALRYQNLEDEFRCALHMEANRFEKLEQSYCEIIKENNSLKCEVDSLRKKDNESKSLITEMTTVIKDQKSKLTEISKSKQEINRENKERIVSLETHLEEARKQIIQIELTKQENKKMQAKLTAQESIIEGLKTERKLWSEELAQQGYLLTQDRSKLECKIEALNSEISNLKMQMESEAVTLRNKCHLIEEQTATILKLKEGLSDKDRETKLFCENLLDSQKQFENQVKTLEKENSDQKEIINRLNKRKEELKEIATDLQEKLDESMATQEMVNQKWKEKSELIAKLESQVVQMKSYWEKKTDELTEERNEAIERNNSLTMELETITENYKQKLELAYKNRDFIKQQADERVAVTEDEMRKLLLETEGERKKLQLKLKILNKAVQELEEHETGKNIIVK